MWVGWSMGEGCVDGRMGSEGGGGGDEEAGGWEQLQRAQAVPHAGIGESVLSGGGGAAYMP